MKGQEKIFHASGNQKKTRVAILMSDKIGFKSKTITREKGHYILIEQSIHQENVTILNIYAPNFRAPKYIKEILTNLKEERDNTIIVGDFSTSLSMLKRSSIQKINK